jgi:hypothetical protein
LTFAMVADAVDQGVREADDLDWKQALPVDVEKKLKEFAKDVAAMANTRGGLIVYGVREEQERAVELLGVPTGERERGRLRALANRHIRPLVGQLEIDELTSDDGALGLIVVAAAASPDAPHVVGERNEMGVPFRHGPHTEWMSEHQIERAYRDRFTRRDGEAAALAGLVNDMADKTNLDSLVWLVVAARPTAPLPAVISRPSHRQVRAVLDEALRLGNQIYPAGPLREPVLRELGNAIDELKVGLRRWVVSSSDYSRAGGLASVLHVELHHDGASAMAVCVGQWTHERPPTYKAMPIRAVECAIVDALALGAANSRSRGHVGQLAVRTTVLIPSNAEAGAVDDTSGGSRVSFTSQVPGSRLLRKVTPVLAEVAADAELASFRSVARQLAEDVFHQFGVTRISIPE